MNATVVMPSSTKRLNHLSPAAQYKRSEVVVYETNNYSMFKLASGNRSVNELHLNRLMKSIKEECLFTTILVNENMEVIDGQHRLKCFEALGLPVYFTIAYGYGLREMQKLNLNSRNWNNNDYLTSYISKGMQDYIDYGRFRKKYGFGHRESMQMLTGAIPSDDIFNAGRFKVKDYRKACSIAEDIHKLQPFCPFFNNRSFVSVMIKLLTEVKAFNIKKFVQKCENHPFLLVKCATAEQYLDMIEKLYNYKNQSKVSLKY